MKKKIEQLELDKNDLSAPSAEDARCGFNRRLRAILSSEKSAASFAKRAGISQSGLNRLEHGGDPTLPTLIAIADAANVSVEWLATGGARCENDCVFEQQVLEEQIDNAESAIRSPDAPIDAVGPGAEFVKTLRSLVDLNDRLLQLYRRQGVSGPADRRLLLASPKQQRASDQAELSRSTPESGSGSTASLIEPNEPDEVVLIPRYDAALAAGAGSFNERARLLDHIPFTRNFIIHKLGRNNPDGLVILEARGDSMEPTIGDGDLVLLDQHRREARDGIVAFALGDTAFIKRLRFTFDGVDLISDNRDLYEPEHLSRQRAEEIVIIGRVRWVGRMF